MTDPRAIVAIKALGYTVLTMLLLTVALMFGNWLWL